MSAKLVAWAKLTLQTHDLHGLQVVLKLAALAGRLPFPEVPHGEEGLIETLWLLLTSVIAVPLVCKLPGGSPVLGFLVRHPPFPRLAG